MIWHWEPGLGPGLTRQKLVTLFPDGKEYDAFVSYLKDCITTNDGEGKFALEILPKTLEEHFGYKLCIFERDITPGGGKQMK